MDVEPLVLTVIHETPTETAYAARDALDRLVKIFLMTGTLPEYQENEGLGSMLAGLLTGIDVLAEALYGKDGADKLTKLLESAVFEGEPGSVG